MLCRLPQIAGQDTFLVFGCLAFVSQVAQSAFYFDELLPQPDDPDSGRLFKQDRRGQGDNDEDLWDQCGVHGYLRASTRITCGGSLIAGT